MDDTRTDAGAGVVATGPAEEIVVVRLEGLGTFAIPVACLDDYRLADQPAVDGGGPVAVPAPVDAVPVILEQDFLRGATSDRSRLTVDRFGGVHRPEGGHVFGEPPPTW
ncbi:MAG: hypothetical protein JWM47_568 [Acidimicrobiales bacterium]|nr:hypothetical protein [Acidimicrobiales bacterium]